jgi:hypothetical protein
MGAAVRLVNGSDSGAPLRLLPHSGPARAGRRNCALHPTANPQCNPMIREIDRVCVQVRSSGCRCGGRRVRGPPTWHVRVAAATAQSRGGGPGRSRRGDSASASGVVFGAVGILDQVVDEVGNGLHHVGRRQPLVARDSVGAGGGTGPDGDALAVFTLAHTCTVRVPGRLGVSSRYVPRPTRARPRHPGRPPARAAPRSSACGKRGKGGYQRSSRTGRAWPRSGDWSDPAPPAAPPRARGR